MTDTLAIDGWVAPGFEAARDAFAANFQRPGDYQEVGAALAAYHDGRLVVDLWGGHADRARTRSFRQDSLVNVWSATKGIVATAAAMLVDAGVFDYADPVTRFWPEFGQAGKGGTTIGQLLSHQAGLPGFAEPTEVMDQCDWAGCVGKLERQAPLWPAGEASSYHAMTYGWLAGEVIRRATGRTVGRVVRDEIALPLNADLHIGLPESLEGRVAETIGPIRPADPAMLASLPGSAIMALTNPAQDSESPNLRAWRAAEIPAANGHASALGLAKLYAALVFGGLDGARLVSRETLGRMTGPAAPKGRIDQFLGFADCWGMGVALNAPGIYGDNPEAYGHSGWGGSFGCADPGAGVAIGYVCNRMGPELVGDPRTAGLCQAILEAALRA
jgi:CubicO group peptidase (beta-lactamase class C family)